MDKIKIKVTVGVGLVGCSRTKIIEINASELEDLEGDDRNRVIEEYAREAKDNMVEWDYEEA